MVMRGLKAARLRQKETINYNISVSLVLTLLHIYVLFLTGRNKSKPICSQLMSKCNYSNARKKNHTKRKREECGRKQILCFMCGQIQEITNMLLQNTEAFTFVRSHIYTKDIVKFLCEIRFFLFEQQNKFGRLHPVFISILI